MSLERFFSLLLPFHPWSVRWWGRCNSKKKYNTKNKNKQRCAKQVKFSNELANGTDEDDSDNEDDGDNEFCWAANSKNNIFPISKLTRKSWKRRQNLTSTVTTKIIIIIIISMRTDREREWIRASRLASKMNDILWRKQEKRDVLRRDFVVVRCRFFVRFVSFPKSLAKSDGENQRTARVKASAAAFSWTLVCARTTELKWKD